MKKILFSMAFGLLPITVWAQYEVGDIYNSNGVKGMVVTVDDSGQHGLLISLKESEEDWTKDDDLNLVTSAFYEDDGEKNMQAIETFISENGKKWSDFPVFKWARSLGDGWYIPAKDELVKIWTNLNGGDLKLDKKSKSSWKSFNKIIKKAKGDDFYTKLSPMESGLNHVLMGMISSTECEGGNIGGIDAVGRLVIMDALPSPNATIEISELKKNNHSETKNALSVRRKFNTRAVHKF